MRKDAGILVEVVTLLRDLEDVDMGVGDGKAVTLDAVVVVRDDTEDTVVDFGWRVAGLLLEIDRREDSRLGVLMGLAVGDLVAIDIVRDCVGVTLLSEDNAAEVTLVSLTASGIVPTTEWVDMSGCCCSCSCSLGLAGPPWLGARLCKADGPEKLALRLIPLPLVEMSTR
jgi:hypothetical protein